jgi:hypothetical protein
MVAGRFTPAATDSSPSPGVARWWPFRAQLPVRTVAAPEGASRPRPRRRVPSATRRPPSRRRPLPRRDRTAGIASVCARSPLYLTPTGVGCLPPPACWPPDRRKARGAATAAMPGRQGRMSGTPPPRSSPRHSHSPLTACPGPRCAGHGRWRGRGRAFGACCFAGKLRSPVGPGPGATVAEARNPYADPYADLYADPYAGHPRTPPPAESAVCPGDAPRGEWSGQAARSASRD